MIGSPYWHAQCVQLYAFASGNECHVIWDTGDTPLVRLYHSISHDSAATFAKPVAICYAREHSACRFGNVIYLAVSEYQEGPKDIYGAKNVWAGTKAIHLLRYNMSPQ